MGIRVAEDASERLCHWASLSQPPGRMPACATAPYARALRLARSRPQRAPRGDREYEVEHKEPERDDAEHRRDPECGCDDAADHRPRDLAEVETAVEERGSDAVST